MTEILTAVLYGKKIAYTSRSQFLVQVGKGSKGAYKTKYIIHGNLAQAIIHYNGINLGNGYKKRLICFSMNKPLLLRATS